MKKIVMLVGVVILSMFATQWFAAADKMMMDDHNYHLENVTGDATIRWIVTDDSAMWHASVSYTDWVFVLHAGFAGLTDPQGDDFYEGWLVQKSPFKFISTGELKKEDGKYVNHFESSIDYTSYDFYVLTLEPNDGDDAPADHIFEGTVMMKSADHMMKKWDDNMMMKDKMMDASKDKMMKPEDPKRKLLKMSVADRVSKINLSDTKIDLILSRIDDLETKLPTLKLSDSKKQQYIEILSVLKEVLLDKKSTMMQK